MMQSLQSKQEIEMNTTVYAFTVATRDHNDRLVARVIAHFEFSNDGRQAAELAMKAIPDAGFEGPVGSAKYPIGHLYFAE